MHKKRGFARFKNLLIYGGKRKKGRKPAGNTKHYFPLKMENILSHPKRQKFFIFMESCVSSRRLFFLIFPKNHFWVRGVKIPLKLFSYFKVGYMKWPIPVKLTKKKLVKSILKNFQNQEQEVAGPLIKKVWFP